MVSRLLPATPEMAERVSELVHSSFNELAAADWEPEAREVFLAESSPVALAEALHALAFGAVEAEDNTFIGFILMRKPSLVDMLFVHPEHLRKGVARRLWEAARVHIEATHPEVKTVELNATPYAFNAYRALGFVPISKEFTRGG